MNADYVRTLLLYIDGHLEYKSSGRARPIHLKRCLDDSVLEDIPRGEILIAAQYLVERKLVTVAVENVAPRAYVFTGISAEGRDFIAAIKDDTLWHKLAKLFGNVFSQSAQTVIDAVVGFGLKKLGL